MRAIARDVSKVNRVKAVIEFMDKTEGYGWKRRMEKRDHYMDQDMPRRWTTGRIPSWAMLRKLEEYAARFGYAMPPAYLPHTTFRTPVYGPDIVAKLDDLNNT